jgi:hypothetical protein
MERKEPIGILYSNKKEKEKEAWLEDCCKEEMENGC